MEKSFKALGIFTTAYITLLLVSNIIASKVSLVFGITGTAAMWLVFPLSYVINDIITEVYGYAESRRFIWYGTIANVLMVVLFTFALALPYPAFWTSQEAFRTVLGAVPRTVIFSIIGFWVGSFVNAFVLARMKEWMVKWDPNSKFLFLRTIASTVAGEGVDSFIFIPGIFIGILPLNVILTMILIQWGIKTLIEVVMTPVTYVVVNGVKKLEGIDIVGSKTWNPFKVTK